MQYRSYTSHLHSLTFEMRLLSLALKRNGIVEDTAELSEHTAVSCRFQAPNRSALAALQG